MSRRERFTEIGLLLYPGCQMASVHGLGDAFSIANHYSDEHGGAARIVTTHWSLGASGCARVWASHPAPKALPDVVIVPGRLTPPMAAHEAAAYSGFLRDCHDHGATLASVCVGAFILGHSGLLGGRRVTTHWYYGDAFRAAFPRAELIGGDILTEDGDILTAAGMMAWTDLALRLIHRIHGPTVLADTAKFLLVDPAGREQRHYSRFAPKLNHGDAAILKVQHWLQTRLGKDVSIAAMANEAVLSRAPFFGVSTRPPGCARRSMSKTFVSRTPASDWSSRATV